MATHYLESLLKSEIKDLKGIQTLVKEMTGTLIQEMLEAELENELGYSKWDYRNKNTNTAEMVIQRRHLWQGQ